IPRCGRPPGPTQGTIHFRRPAPHRPRPPPPTMTARPIQQRGMMMPPGALQVTSSPARNGFDFKMLPDAVAHALAFVIAEKDRDYQRMLDAREADHRAAIAELRAAYAEQRLTDLQRIQDLADIIVGYRETIDDAIANLKNG